VANPVRGEAELKLGGDTFTLAATMESIAVLSSDLLRCDTLVDLYKRLIGAEPRAVRTALRLMCREAVVDGERLTGAKAGEAAVAAWMLSDAGVVRDAFAMVLEAFTRPAPDRPGEESHPPNA
jgi:hypothetical protein